MNDHLLNVENLRVGLNSNGACVHPVDGVSFAMDQNEAVGIVGESGCGKTMLALSILKLLPKPGGRIESGQILWSGIDMSRMPESKIRAIRGKEIGMVFQEPMTSLNPVMTIGKQIGEAIAVHSKFGREEIKARTHELLRLVGVAEAARRAKNYPHELSGGLRQRAMIAMALACGPKLLIADEPTTALDVTIQAQILELIAKLQHDLGMSLLLVTHDFGVVAEVTRRVIVMYAGQFVEEGTTAEVFSRPLHPYTKSLLKSLPAKGKGRLFTIPGRVPDLGSVVAGCRFADRCFKAKDVCKKTNVCYEEADSGRFVRCLFPEG